jgi:hypothetical protein
VSGDLDTQTRNYKVPRLRRDYIGHSWAIVHSLTEAKQIIRFIKCECKCAWPTFAFSHSKTIFVLGSDNIQVEFLVLLIKPLHTNKYTNTQTNKQIQKMHSIKF